MKSETYMVCLSRPVGSEPLEAKCCKCGEACFHTEKPPEEAKPICVKCMGKIAEEKGAVLTPTENARKLGAHKIILQPTPKFAS